MELSPSNPYDVPLGHRLVPAYAVTPVAGDSPACNVSGRASRGSCPMTKPLVLAGPGAADEGGRALSAMLGILQPPRPAPHLIVNSGSESVLDTLVAGRGGSRLTAHGSKPAARAPPRPRRHDHRRPRLCRLGRARRVHRGVGRGDRPIQPGQHSGRRGDEPVGGGPGVLRDRRRRPGCTAYIAEKLARMRGARRPLRLLPLSPRRSSRGLRPDQRRPQAAPGHGQGRRRRRSTWTWPRPGWSATVPRTWVWPRLSTRRPSTWDRRARRRRECSRFPDLASASSFILERIAA